MAIRNVSGTAWTLRRTSTAAGGARRRAVDTATDVIPPEFLASSRVEAVFEAEPAAAERRAAPPDLVLDVDVKNGEAALIAIRHPSGALTFHPGTETVASTGRRRGRTAAPTVVRFRIPIRRIGTSAGRRGVGSTIKLAVIKVTSVAGDKVVSVVLPKLAEAWERRAWARKQLQEGWFAVAPGSGADRTLRLTPGVPEPGQRTLLFLHGTFSDAVSAFGDLAGSDFFERLRPIYGSRIYAFNHFSISRTPEENADQLLRGLPAGTFEFDVVAHSRGGLILRSLVEQRDRYGVPGERVTVRHAVLVAAPNDGTPLATPARWEETVGWFANLMEVLPDNPFTTGSEFVAEAIVWLASHLAGDLPGLRAMDRAGDLISEIQLPPGPPPNTYSALVANVHPDDRLWERALDVGVDAFFASANDLVVPTEGGWRIDRDGSPHVPADRIGCFGPGGNIAGTVPTHVSFFERPETADFIAKALAGQPHGLPAIDPDSPLPDRRFAHGRRAAVAAPVEPALTEAAPAGPQAAPSLRPIDALAFGADTDTMHIVIMDSDDAQADDADARVRARTAKAPSPEFARVFATYGGARVTTQMRLRTGRDGATTRWGSIIKTHEQIKLYTNRVGGALPDGDGMMAFGSDLFETLFQGEVRRLYDEARSRQRQHKLDIVLTSMIPWIGEKPWEFAYDRGRESFLATEDVHFVRNVLTAIPADPIKHDSGPLRILVASAQPVGFGHLSIDEEVDVIRRGFESLIEAGLVSVETLPRATPEAIHGHLQTGSYDVVHFIGHGEFDEAQQQGYLIFQDTRGGEFRLGRRSVRELFCGRGLSLVFLNACQTGQGGRADFNKGVAQAVVQHGLPALVANQYSVLDSSATSFAQHFYWSLAQGNSVGAAAREARIAVNYSLSGELIDWAVPVVYARDPNMALCARRGDVSTVPTARVRRGSRRATGARTYRIAVWDIDDVFPAMEQTLSRMNGAQEVFGFELVDMSVPLDAWDMERRSPENTPYLWAERLAARLEGKAVELRVDLLCCVTRHWMRDDKTMNIFAWWPTTRRPPIVLFSCAGFDMKAQGPATDRAIANATVSALAGFFGKMDTHTRGARDCPLAYNADRDVRYVAGRLKFEARCRRALSKAMAKEMPALEALLTAFP